MHIKHIHNAIEKIAEDLSCDVDKGVENMNAEIAEKQAEMLEKLCTAEYYAHIAKAMKKSEEEDEEEAEYILKQMKEEYGDEGGEEMYRRMGYNRNRYSNGRFAPRGRGRRMGYMPPEMRYPYYEDMIGMDEYDMMPMGYGNGRGEESRYGRSYGNYRNSKRHYTETKDEKSKKDMEMSMKEYTEDVMDNIKEMWRDADPALRQTMKADLTKMVQQLQ